MSLFESDFMRRARYLTKDKRAFLLDTMEETRKEFKKILPIYHQADSSKKQLMNKSWNHLLQKTTTTMWMLVDNPQGRSLQQIEKRLNEIDKLVQREIAADVYTASHLKIYGERFGQIEWGISIEDLREEKEKEYEDLMKEYTNLSDADRDRFIREVTHPYSTYKPHRLVKMGRGIAD